MPPFRPFLVLLLGLVLAVIGCDTAFDPYAATDRYYAAYGYLNPAADTQWVRVEPLQDSILVGTTRDIDARLTMENVSTGTTVNWRDSLVRVEGTPAWMHAFWTTAEIQPAHTYQIAIERQRDGARATAEATVPATRHRSLDCCAHRLLSRPEAAFRTSSTAWAL